MQKCGGLKKVALMFVEDLRINCGDEESECCVLCDCDNRESYVCPCIT